MASKSLSKQIKTEKQVVAAFDFDGTITYCDSATFFLLFLTGFPKFFLSMAARIPTLLAFLLGKAGRQETKENIFEKFFKGTPISALRTEGEKYSRGWLPKLVRKQALKRIHWHLEEGHRLVLISASLDIYLEPWAKAAGFHDVLSSRLATDKEGLATGKLNGANCRGPEKVRRLKELLGPLDLYTLYAYGDSEGDKELLDAADFPFWRTMKEEKE